VRIALTIAASLTAPCREKLFAVAGPKLGSEGKIMIGLKRVLVPMSSIPRPARKPSGEKYEYALCYVDNVLAISASP
jgi:hypothetical protein